MFEHKTLQSPTKLSLFFAIIMTFVVGAVNAQPDRTRSFADIAKKVAPAIVSIDTTTKILQPADAADAVPNSSNDLLDDLRKKMLERPLHELGSGFIVDKSGYVITNAHVIDDAERITVKLDTGEEFSATVVGFDGREETDIAVLKIDVRRDLPFLKFGDSDNAEIGDWVLTVGSPFGLAKSVSAGIISQTRRETPGGSAFQRFIQTDAVINPGNSGGPLVNMDGDVIGVNSQIATATGGYNGVGFALPSNEAGNVYAQILKNGKVRRGFLGAYLDSVKPEFASVYGLPEAKGAIVTDIRDKLVPAAVAGLMVGDIVVEFDGRKIDNARDLITKVASTPPEKAVSIVYLREIGTNLERKTALIRLAERPTSNRTAVTDSGKPPIKTIKEEPKPFGMTLNELTPVLAEKYKLQGLKGLVVREIAPASFITDVRNSLGGIALGEGDLIQRINRVDVTNLKAFADMVSRLKPGDPVVLHIKAYDPSLRRVQLQIVQFTVR